MTLRIRSMLRWAFFALPFQMRQCRRSTSLMIIAFAVTRSGLLVDKFAAASCVCCKRIAIWNQSKIGGFVTPALARTARKPGQPSVKAVTLVVSVRPTVSRVRWISTVMSVSALVTAPKTWRPPSTVSTLPTRTSKWRSPSSRLRMKVESKLIVIAAAAAGGFSAAASPSCLPTCSVWLRIVSGLVPASIGGRYCSLGMTQLAERGATVALEIQRGGVEEGDRDRAEQRFAVFIQRLLDGVGAVTRLSAVLAVNRIAQPGHGLVGMIEHQVFRAGDVEGLLPCAGMAVRAGDHQPVNDRQVDRAFDVEAEAPPGQMPAQYRLAAGLPPEVAEHQVGADTVAADLRQFAAVEAGQHDGAAGVPRGGGDQAVEEA